MIIKIVVIFLLLMLLLGMIGRLLFSPKRPKGVYERERQKAVALCHECGRLILDNEKCNCTSESKE